MLVYQQDQFLVRPQLHFTPQRFVRPNFCRRNVIQSGMSTRVNASQLEKSREKSVGSHRFVTIQRFFFRCKMFEYDWHAESYNINI